MKIKEKIKIGIDKIGFAMPKYFLDIRDLALGTKRDEHCTCNRGYCIAWGKCC